MRLLSAVLLVILLPTTLLAFQNEPDGFRGIKWGANVSNLRMMQFARDVTADFGGISIYKNVDDEMKIGEATVQEIKYYFWQNKFFKITTSADDQISALNLYRACMDNFGTRVDISHGTYTWTGKTTIVQLSGAFDAYSQIVIKSTDLSRKLQSLEDQKRMGQKVSGF